MAYAFNQIDELMNKDQSSSIFSQGADGGAIGSASPQGSGGGEAIGSGGGQSSSAAPAVKSAPTTMSSASTAAQAQAQKSQSTGSEAKYLEGAKKNVQEAVGSAQAEADKYVQGSGKDGIKYLNMDYVGQRLGSDPDLQNRIRGYLSPEQADAKFAADAGIREKIGGAKSEVERLGTAEGLGADITKQEGGGEFSRKLAKNVARGAIATDVYKKALEEARTKAEGAEKQVADIEGKATGAAQGKIGEKQKRQAEATKKQLEDYKQILVEKAKGQASREAQSIGSGLGSYADKQAMDALREAYPTLNDAARLQLLQTAKASPGGFALSRAPAALDWRQFVGGGDMSRISGIEELLGGPRTEASGPYGGREQFYSFDKQRFLDSLKTGLSQQPVAPLPNIATSTGLTVKQPTSGPTGFYVPSSAPAPRAVPGAISGDWY